MCIVHEQYIYCFAAMMFESCSVDPRIGNILTSPEFTLSSDQELTFTMASVPSSSYSTVNVYKTSILGRVDTLLGSHSPEGENSVVANITDNICLPAGTYQLVFIASEVVKTSKSSAAVTEVLLSNASCAYTSLAGNH